MNNIYLSERKVSRTLFFFIFFTLVLAIWFRATPNLFIEGKSYLSTFKYSHYLFDYSQEFVKRGFIGETFNALGVHKTYNVISLFSYGLLILLNYVLLLVFTSPYRKYKKTGLLFFSIIAIANPATLQHFVLDVGRYDILLVVIMLASIYIIRTKKPATTFGAINFLVVSGLLIHEAFLFISVPLILSYWYYKQNSKYSIELIALTAVIVTLATALIKLFGNIESLSLEEHFKMLSLTYGEGVNASSISVAHKTGVMENIKFALSIWKSKKTWINHGLMLAFLAPLLLVIYKLVRLLAINANAKTQLILLCAAFPLTLYLLGSDVYRWWALAITNILVVISLICLDNEKAAHTVNNFLLYKKTYLYSIIALAFISGPLGVNGSFSSLIKIYIKIIAS